VPGLVKNRTLTADLGREPARRCSCGRTAACRRHARCMTARWS